MASAAMMLGSSGHAFLVPLEAPQPAAPRAATAGAAELRAPTASSGLLAGSAPSWATLGCLAAAALAAGAAGAKRTSRRRRRVVAAAAAKDSDAIGRADLFRGLTGAGAGAFALPLQPAPASAASLDNAIKTLTTYGLAEIAPAKEPAFGWGVTVEPIGLAPDAYYGRFNLGGEPQVVLFYSPPLWVVSKPNIDYNGAAGTVGANDYNKGDAATLWVNTEYSGVPLAEFTKKEYKTELLRGLTTKGKGFIEGLKIGKVRDGAPGYKLVEYDYDVESAAGFTLARSGIAAFAQVGADGKKLQVFWTATVTGRWKNMKEELTTMVDSFRIANVPKGISNASIKEFKTMDEAMSSADVPRASY